MPTLVDERAGDRAGAVESRQWITAAERSSSPPTTPARASSVVGTSPRSPASRTASCARDREPGGVALVLAGVVPLLRFDSRGGRHRGRQGRMSIRDSRRSARRPSRRIARDLAAPGRRARTGRRRLLPPARREHVETVAPPGSLHGDPGARAPSRRPSVPRARGRRGERRENGRLRGVGSHRPRAPAGARPAAATSWRSPARLESPQTACAWASADVTDADSVARLLRAGRRPRVPRPLARRGGLRGGRSAAPRTPWPRPPGGRGRARSSTSEGWATERRPSRRI